MQNIIEIVIAAIIITSSLILFVRNIKKKSLGDCDCGHCSKSNSCSTKNNKLGK